MRGGSRYRLDNGNSIGALVSFGQFDYDFSHAVNQPWNDIYNIRFSVPMRFRVGEKASVFASPQFRWDYQSGVPYYHPTHEEVLRQAIRAALAECRIEREPLEDTRCRDTPVDAPGVE